MFYQNSNDLVKNASVSSGHVQNSNDTRGMLIRNTTIPDFGNNPVSNNRHNPTTESSLSIGAKFQNMIQGLIDTVSLKEGIDTTTGSSIVAASGIPDANAIVKNTKELSDQVTIQDIAHIKKKDKTMEFILEKDPTNPRITWAEVSDSTGNTKYGYITKDGIFQIWHAPGGQSKNWIKTTNTNTLKCPGPEKIAQIKIAGTWNSIKPYDMVYSASDSNRQNPLFILANPAVRGPKGAFSCGNESENVFVSERPSADFEISNSTNMCYSMTGGAPDLIGWTQQKDLGDASISQCKRRAEDLGRSHFFLAPSENNNQPDQGMCLVYTNSGTPNVSSWLAPDTTGTACHTVAYPDESQEDAYMNAYPTTVLPRVYGRVNNRNVSVGFYSLKKSGPTGVNDGKIGKLAYIDHNGTKHEYPPSALSYKSNRYITLNGFDTRDSESSYSLKTLEQRNKFPPLGNMKNWELNIVFNLDSVENSKPYETRPVPDSDGKCPWGWFVSEGKCYQQCLHNSQGRMLDGTCLCGQSYPNNGCGPQQFQCVTHKFSVGSNSAYYSKCDRPVLAWRPLIGDMYNDVNKGRGWGVWVSPTYKIHWSWQDTTHNSNIEVKHNEQYKLKIINTPTTLTIILKNMYSQDAPQKETIKKPNNARMTTNGPVTVGGWLNNKGERFQGDISEIHVPNLYIKRGRLHKMNDDGKVLPESDLMTVGESVDLTKKECSVMCDSNEKCGGFVFTDDGNEGAVGKCELKDRDKMYPVGVRISDPTKQLIMKVPSINETVKDPLCKNEKSEYSAISTVQYAHYPLAGTISADTKCDIKDKIPKDGALEFPDVSSMIDVTGEQDQNTQSKMAELERQKQSSGLNGFTVLREGMEISGGNYVSTMTSIQKDLGKIANAEYQRERLLAMTEESNKLLISESYKFILWSILAILAIMALLKLKEMFGQEDAVGDGDGDGGLFAYILGLFGMGSLKTDDIADRTGDVKEALSSAGDQLKEAGENLTTGITEGADKLVSSANEAAAGAVEGAKGLADKVSETATDAVNKVGDAVGRAGAGTGAGTGGGRGDGRSKHGPTRTSRKK